MIVADILSDLARLYASVDLLCGVGDEYQVANRGAAGAQFVRLCFSDVALVVIAGAAISSDGLDLEWLLVFLVQPELVRRKLRRRRL